MSQNAIEIRNLSKIFPMKAKLFSRKSDGVHAIDSLSMDIKQGEIVGLVGESGSGKTTLARVILGLTKISKGSVILFERLGTEISTVSRKISNIELEPLCEIGEMVLCLFVFVKRTVISTDSINLCIL